MVDGDSKSSNAGTWMQPLADAMAVADGAPWMVYNLASAGSTVATRAAAIDANLLAYTGFDPEIVVLNLGANDVALALNEATWKTNLAYLLDAYHARWPNAEVYVSTAWRVNEDTDCDSLAAWKAAVIADGRAAWCFEGVDERGAAGLESTDNGATYYSDGIHFSAAWQARYKTLMLTALGY